MTTREILLKIIDTPAQNKAMELATVLSVEGYTCTVNIESSDTEIQGVKLQAFETNGVLLTPTVGSKVYIVPYFSDYFVFMYSSIDEIKLLDGSFGGLVKVSDLVDKLNNLENKVNSIINTFNAHVHSGVTTGAGSSAVTPTLISGTLTPTNVSEVENPLIRHGEV